ncbi:hypothetical protein [Allobaculum sp. JKK-2023]|uniref:hypothetical protein n=1 Tax=Allobaculum sp. JKK-2023 TaxID=3108943 RepID=UPI002B05C6E6|nr:hypothetical protein [Allobaculum sp. JKK-2023]
MALIKKTLITLLAASLWLGGCHLLPLKAADESYADLAEKIPDQQSLTANASTEKGLLYRLMSSCALQSAKEEFESPAVIVNYRTLQGHWTIIFKEENALYEITLMEDYLNGGIGWCYVAQTRNGRRTQVNMGRNQGTIYHVGSSFERDSEFGDDFNAQIQSDVEAVLSLDSFLLLREFPDYFDVWENAKSDVHRQYAWKVTDRDALSEAISNSRYVKLGNTIPPDCVGTFTVVSSGAVIEWSNTDFEGRQNVGAIRVLEGMNTQFWIDFFNQPLPQEESEVDLAGAWPENLPAF